MVHETGELVTVRFTPEGYDEVDRTLLLTPTTRTQGGASVRWEDRAVLWAHPAFANRHVLARNDAEVEKHVIQLGFRPDDDCPAAAFGLRIDLHQEWS